MTAPDETARIVDAEPEVHAAVAPLVTLTDGLTLNGSPQLQAELRTLGAGEILDASAAAERAVKTEHDGYQLVTSPALAGFEVLRRMILRIGDIKGPLPLDMLRRLSGVDLQLLQAKADELDAAAAARLAREMAARGRDSRASGGP